MLHLPAEIVLAILQYLPLNSISRLPSVCKLWKDFIETHESTVYRNAAALYHYIPSPETLFKDLGQLYSHRSLTGVETWKDLCCRRLDIKRSWEGKAPSKVVEYKSRKAVHRIKVDGDAGYIITTSQRGGLAVTDLEEGKMLWTLPNRYVRQFAHCEYGNGFLIFDRMDGSKEVWRREKDYTEKGANAVDIASKPDHHQNRMSDLTFLHIHPSSTPRGRFKPWALLQMPEITRAYRFVYPTLLVAAFTRVFLWDIRTGSHFQTIEDIQLTPGGGWGLGELNYVEVSPRHVFVCGEHAIRVFDRGSGKHVLDISSSYIVYGNWKYTLARDERVERREGSALVNHKVDVARVTPLERPRLIDEFIAAHVSTCGRHLVGLLSSSRLVIIYNFERIIRGEATLHDLALDVQLGSPRSASVYLAFENDRVAVVTHSGVFIITVDPSSQFHVKTKTPPTLLVSRIPTFIYPPFLASVSCLQMTDTGLFLNWTPTPLGESQDELEEKFQESLHQQPLYANLPEGDQMVLHDAVDTGFSFSHVSSVSFV
ncbi:hypothetical protein BDQ12DRAFT_700895 [Crucibulum laeve]|uniref:F-box domain-containing protein n=1 Tax=Crucibulum laeve TaxID=68775 RepID=A0A5C3LMG2_9AGAR|nr:hypothetical protein BDQ12DRAFT_700895 [Crucibulum laeve]